MYNCRMIHFGCGKVFGDLVRGRVSSNIFINKFGILFPMDGKKMWLHIRVAIRKIKSFHWFLSSTKFAVVAGGIKRRIKFFINNAGVNIAIGFWVLISFGVVRVALGSIAARNVWLALISPPLRSWEILAEIADCPPIISELVRFGQLILGPKKV